MLEKSRLSESSLEGTLVLGGGYWGEDASELAVAGYNPPTKTPDISLSLGDQYIINIGWLTGSCSVSRTTVIDPDADRLVVSTEMIVHQTTLGNNPP